MAIAAVLFLPTAVEYILDRYIYFYIGIVFISTMRLSIFMIYFVAMHSTHQTEDKIQNPEPQPEDLSSGLVAFGMF